MTKGIPKRDGSGKGRRANKGRGGCSSTQIKGKKKRSITDELNRLRKEHHKKTGTWFYPEERAEGLKQHWKKKEGRVYFR